MYNVYLLRSKKDGKFYIGQTKDLEKRLLEHSKGKVLATKNRLPLVLLGYESYNTRQEARWREFNIKHHSAKKKKFIEQFNIKYQV